MKVRPFSLMCVEKIRQNDDMPCLQMWNMPIGCDRRRDRVKEDVSRRNAQRLTKDKTISYWKAKTRTICLKICKICCYSQNMYVI